MNFSSCLNAITSTSSPHATSHIYTYIYRSESAFILNENKKLTERKKKIIK